MNIFLVCSERRGFIPIITTMSKEKVTQILVEHGYSYMQRYYSSKFSPLRIPVQELR